MKKLLIIMGILSIFSCNKYKKIYRDNPMFSKIESSAKISLDKAIGIYETSFFENFNIEKKGTHDLNQDRVVYIQDRYYYIGYVSKYDKRGKKEGHIYFLAKINFESGEINVVKE
jgi:hypothetical protein